MNIISKVLFFLAFFVCWPLAAFELQKLGSTQTTVEISYYLDNKNSQDFSNLEANPNWFKPLSKKAFPAKPNESVWLRITVFNHDPDNQDYILNFNEHLFDHIDIYIHNQFPKPLFHTGLSHKADTRAVQHRYFAFPLSIQYQETLIVYAYIEASHYPIISPKIQSAKDFLALSARYDVINLISLGVMLGILCFLSFFLPRVSNKKLALSFIVNIFATLLVVSLISGIGYFFFPNSPYWHNTSIFLSICLAAISNIAVIIHFFDLKNKNMPLYIFLLFYSSIFLLLPLLFFSQVVDGQIIGLTITFILGAYGFLFLVILYYFKQRYPDSGTFLTGITIFMASGFYAALAAMGVVEYSLFVRHSFSGGMVVQALIYSWAAAKRIQQIHLRNIALENKIVIEKQSDQDKLLFYAKVSHEIRTPLNGIIGMIDLIDKNKIEKAEREKLNVIHSASKTLHSLVNDFLDFSKINNQNFSLNPTQFNPYELVNESYELFKQPAANKKIIFNTFIDSDLNQNFISDPTRIQQILNNLISNAIKFTDQGSVTIKACLSYQEEGYALCIVVKDSGIGMNNDSQNQLFKPFSQLNEKHQHKEGMGLGLSIANSLIKSLSGEISFDSQKELGTSFHLSIPLEYAAINSLNADAKSHFNTDKMILVADDNIINQRVIAAMLSRHDLQFKIFDDGMTVSKFYQHNPCSIGAILMDCEMPVQDGFITTKKIRHFEHIENIMPIPIIAITAHALGDIEIKCKASGMDKVLEKPITHEKLISALQYFSPTS